MVQNQPTAGGLLMVNQLYALGPNDGTAIGVPLNGIPAAPLLQPAAARFDAAKLIWLGSTAASLTSPMSGTPRRCKASPT